MLCLGMPGEINKAIAQVANRHKGLVTSKQLRALRLSDGQVDWRVQFNVRSLGESNHLVTVAVEPDGSVAQKRIVGGANYDVSMRFSF